MKRTICNKRWEWEATRSTFDIAQRQSDKKRGDRSKDLYSQLNL